jgi:tRNA(fMet)-specific endonuclease VapC
MTSSGVELRPGRIVIDTSTYSQWGRGNEDAERRVAEAERVLLPTVVLGELSAGFRLGARRAVNERFLAAFLLQPFVEVLAIDADVALRYGELFAKLRRAGTPIPTNDIWIAACTLASGGHLITFDADFDLIEELPRTLLRA